MNDLDLEKFKQLILLQHQELIEMKQKSQKSSQPVTLDQSSVGRLSRMDAMQSQAMALENKRRREIQLTRISAALERIEEGEYGYCASCEEEIDRRRLAVDPANPFCVSCASKM
jgi:DnaK suppressor protein